jgi:hypothetical protein
MIAPLNNHWYIGGGAAVTTTEKAARVPAMFVRLLGCEEMFGANQTVTVAGELVIAPAEFVIMTK